MKSRPLSRWVFCSSVDANRGGTQLGWDTDQFPISVEENALVMYEILKAGGFTTGGLNFDAKVRRQAPIKYDLRSYRRDGYVALRR